MSVSATYTSNLQVVETLGTNVPDVAAGNGNVTHSLFNTTIALNGSSSPAASLVAAFQQALSTGAATIDLTALLGTNGATINGNGLKVRSAKFINPATNANPITIKFGGSNPYNLLGASWQVILQPGAELLVSLADAAPVIGSGARNIDLSGTGSQALSCIILIG